jgi:hypothetical protein
MPIKNKTSKEKIEAGLKDFKEGRTISSEDLDKEMEEWFDESEDNDNLTARLMKGLSLAYERMLEFKIYKKSKVVVSRDGKIVELDPSELLKEYKNK